MNTRDWALIAFTTLTQMSVGSFLVLGLVHFFARRKAGLQEADQLSNRALLAIGPVLVLGLAAAFLHLGNPFNAYHAPAHFSGSWLSREVVFSSAFIIVGGVFAIAQWRKIGTPSLRNAVAVLAAIIGVVLVYVMSRVYMLRTHPSWNTIATPITFYTTTCLLGSLAMGAAFVANYSYMHRRRPEGSDIQRDLLRGSLRWISLASIVLVGVHLVVIPLYVAHLSTGGAAASRSLDLLIGRYGIVFALRLGLVFLGAAILGAFIYWNAINPGRERIMGYLAYTAFVLVLVAEIMGRYLFYATQVRIGL
jgi:anaerobic dimethyl sulfoxide reductase subunit C (anchor subunit)